MKKHVHLHMYSKLKHEVYTLSIAVLAVFFLVRTDRQPLLMVGKVNFQSCGILLILLMEEIHEIIKVKHAHLPSDTLK